jgi:DNA helicase-2/ATP-dependent DNA helicase PcrA
MDLWEDIRIFARNHHDELIGNRLDYSVEELLSAAEVSTQIKRYGIPAGDSLLFGAEAMLDLDRNIIWFNNQVDPELIAYYQAHEYAHFWIDDHNAICAPEHLDYDAIETELPVGVDLVEGYGPKERYELQANVFAREFLVPSHKLRKMFVEEQEHADTIAKRIGVYEGLVHHQLMYALLYTTGQVSLDKGEADGKEKPEYALDSSQERAAKNPKGPLLLEAGPGTGKTSTLLGRIKYLLEERDINASSILALTFSNKAAEAMRTRVARIAPDAAPHIWMGTFHAFGLEILRKYGTRIGLSEQPTVLEPAASVLMLEKNLASLELNHYMNPYEPVFELVPILGAISRAKDELVTPERYEELAKQQWGDAKTDKEIELAEKALEVAHVYHVYEELLVDADAVDFGDLIYKTVRLLQMHTDVRDQIRNQYPHILVDEFQDVNYASGVLLKEIAGAGDGLWVVGDARQSIYRFRGAAPRNVSKFAENFPGAEKLSLKINYRSQRHIVDAFEAFAQQMQQTVPGEDFIGWRASRTEDDGDLIMDAAESLESEVQLMAQQIKRLNVLGIPYRDQAVLCRTHTQLEKIARQLEECGIPILYIGELFEREEIRDLLALLSLASEPHGAGLVRIADFSEYRIPIDDVLQLLKAAEEREVIFPKALSIVEDIDQLSEQGQTGLFLLQEHLKDLGFSITAWSFLAKYLFSKSQYLRQLLEDNSVSGQQRRLALHQFLAFVYAFREKPVDVTGDPKRWFLDTVRRLQIFGETKQLRQLPDSADAIDAVRMLTVHASKGLEFSTIYLPYLGQGKFPLSRRGQRCPPPKGMLPKEAENWHEHEEECLFFVGISRAKDFLYLSRATSYGKSGSNNSKFLDAIGHLLPDHYKRKGEKPPSQPEDEVEFIQSSREFKADELDIYLRCPRRYFYHFVLDLGGKNKESAYVQFHRCVYQILDWIDDEHNAGRDIDVQDALGQLGELWSETGPVDHAFELFYFRLAEKMVRNAVKMQSSNMLPLERQEIYLTLDTGVIRFKPDQIVERPDGTCAVRRLRTGHIGSSEKGKAIYALYQHAAKQEFGDEASIEIVSLADDMTEPVDMSERMRSSRLNKYESAMHGIQAGIFDPTPKDIRDCPRCPFYFICPSPTNAD